MQKFKRNKSKYYNITYPKNVPYLEDGLFLSKVFSVADKVGFDNAPFYLRTTRKGSATNSKLFFTDRSIDGFIYAIQNVKDFEKNAKLNKEQVQLINHTVAKFLILALSPSINSFRFKQYFKVISVLRKANLQTINADGLRFRYKKHIRMYNFSKLLFPFYFRLTN